MGIFANILFLFSNVWISCLYVQFENILDTPELAHSEGGAAWKGDALRHVLGEEKPGEEHGRLLLVPKKIYGQTTHHFKDINIYSFNRWLII